MRLPSRTSKWLLLLGLTLAGSCAASALAGDDANTATLDRRRSVALENVEVAGAVDVGHRIYKRDVLAGGGGVGTNPSLIKAATEDTTEGTIKTPWNSFTLAFIMILVSEIGDKTFLIAALMAMKHSRLLVFSAAISSLIVMTILSALLGHAVPTLLPKRFTSFAAGILFLVFGVKMGREGLAMDPNTGVDEELEEVEQEIAEESGISKEMELESGLAPKRSSSRSPSPSVPSGASLKDFLAGCKNLASLMFSPAWVSTFVMTFLGEWGDRSQIATIAMAAGQGYTWVIIGAVAGHSICTGAAVIGGRMVATKISLRNITLGGAVAFLVFGVLYLIESMYGSSE